MICRGSPYSTIILYIQTDPDEKSMETLSTNLQLARLVGVQGTPATIIGDEMIPGAVSWETLEAVVKEKLAVAHAQ
ncbi:TPA: DsbA family protein [Escherichia coli]|nr:scsC protein [Escherichia coli]EJW3583253.1 DsbA family protein [Shigella flexneri]HBR5206604.1 DsbA family protein [Klebsiella pneumoniae]EEU2828160.1 scsC protein [Escherichia coli]EFA4390840.1 scsC protein [Escherichia coli]